MDSMYRTFLKSIIIVFIVLFQSCIRDEVPDLKTLPITNLTGNSASCGGEITDEGSEKIISRGVCWSKMSTPTVSEEKTTDGQGAGSFTSYISGLEAATKYYVRAYASSGAGTGYGLEVSFTTLGMAPGSSVSDATNVTMTSATLNGSVSSNYLSTTVVFEYGASPSYGTNITAKQSPVNNNTETSVSADLNALLPNTIYHYRIKASNGLGITFSDDKSFSTLPDANTPLVTDSIIDIDGNIYDVVMIGTQLWMAENLKTSRYNDGSSIQLVTDSIKWTQLYEPAMCFYRNSETTYGEGYGALYNWYSVVTGKLCPSGWHIPSADEWNTLINFTGGENVAGIRLKEAGSDHWVNPGYADNSSGFTARPGGNRKIYNGEFSEMGTEGYWTSSTLGAGALSMGVRFYGPFIFVLNSSSDGIKRVDTSCSLPFSGKNRGVSVRCLRD